MKVKEEIYDYIYRNETAGALLFTGQWGCGKSYLIKEMAKELNRVKGPAIAVISLFGLDSVAAINKRVKEEYTGFVIGSLGKAAKNISKAMGKVTKDSLEVASIATNGNPSLSAASQGLSAAMNYDLLGFVEVKNTVGKGAKTRRFVLVFDDLERSNLPKKDLLGTLNEYVENKHIKVIIVADEEKIDGKEYKEYKEKLISRTIRMSADYERLIDCIIDAYLESSNGYKAFLKENSFLLKQVFFESKSNNLRTLKAALADFERVYDTWMESKIPAENMKWALYTFTAEVFIIKVPTENHTNSTMSRRFPFIPDEEKQYLSMGKHNSNFSTLRYWIRNGVWEKEYFIQELQNRYSETAPSSLKRFLYNDFWGLEKKDIAEGMQGAVDLAYSGELSREELIYLLKQVHALKTYSIETPCEISYKKAEDGFKRRIGRIKKDEIKEPKCRIFTEDSQIDEEARLLYKMIERVEDQIPAWENRKRFINYINSDFDTVGYFRKGLEIDEFDDDLLEVFKTRYSSALNEGKHEYARALLGLIFDSNGCSTEDNKSNSRKNFNNLIEWLESQESDDGITEVINKLFVDGIKKSVLMKNYEE